MKRLLLAPIAFYRKYISGAKKAPCCRFTPTCSEYGYHSIDEWGFFVGLILTLFRILRCNPFCKGGYDPVPRRKRKRIPKTELLKRGAVKRYAPVKPPYLMMYERYL